MICGILSKSTFAAHIDASVGLGALIDKSFEGRVYPVVPELPSLLEGVQSAVKFKHLPGVFAVAAAFRYAHVQILFKCAVEVCLVKAA